MSALVVHRPFALLLSNISSFEFYFLGNRCNLGLSGNESLYPALPVSVHSAPNGRSSPNGRSCPPNGRMQNTLSIREWTQLSLNGPKTR